MPDEKVRELIPEPNKTAETSSAGEKAAAPPSEWPDDAAFRQFNAELTALCRVFRVNLKAVVHPKISADTGILMISADLQLIRAPKA